MTCILYCYYLNIGLNRHLVSELPLYKKKLLLKYFQVVNNIVPFLLYFNTIKSKGRGGTHTLLIEVQPYCVPHRENIIIKIYPIIKMCKKSHWIILSISNSLLFIKLYYCILLNMRKEVTKFSEPNHPSITCHLYLPISFIFSGRELYAFLSDNIKRV